MFEELADYRAFELLRTQGMRADYLLTKQASTYSVCVYVCVSMYGVDCIHHRPRLCGMGICLSLWLVRT